MATVDALLDELLPEVGQVQERAKEWVCDYCLGPVDPRYHCCYGCGCLEKAGVPSELLNSVVPVTVAPNPGRWYRRLSTYKAGNPEYRAHLAALAWRFIETHEARLSELAGGPIGVVTPVPSKRGRSYEDQPLRQALAVVRPIEDRLTQTLTFVPAPDIDWRRDYYPYCFDAAGGSVRDEHVLLIEDSWVTGATALATAGALMRAGANGVVTLTLARVIDVSFWEGRAHPYLTCVTGDDRQAYDINRWCR